MAPMISNEQLQKAKDVIFNHTRLIDRKLFEYFFENGTKQACLQALFAYQSADGGFGNGIEPDLLCPDSTGIGAETAMYVLELLNCHDDEVIGDLVDWITIHQNADGYLDHPPANLFNYPHQPWWEHSDKERILALAGILKKWEVNNTGFYAKVREFYSGSSFPEDNPYYSYPYLRYLKYCGTTADDKVKLSNLINRLPVLFKERRAFFPLFNRLWFYASDYFERDFITQDAAFFVSSLHDDGSLENPYPDLPWWGPIHLLDGLILLKKMGFL